MFHTAFWCKNVIRRRLTLVFTNGARGLASSRSLWRRRSDVTLKKSYVHGPSDIPLLGKTVGVVLQETAEKFPDQDAFVYGPGGKRHTYRQLLDEVDRVAAGFLKLGITKGDRLGMMGPDIEEWVLTQYAAARIGAILVNVNPAYQLHELEFALNKAGIKAIVAPQSYKTQDYYGMLSELCHEMKSSQPGNIQSERAPDLRTVIIVGQDKLEGAVMFDDVRDMGGDRRHDIEQIGRGLDFDEPINIQFTSGTTGSSKGTTLTHHNIVNNAYFVGKRLDYDNSIVCGSLPLYHCAGTVMISLASVIHGATCVFPSPGHDPEKILQTIEKERCNIMFGSPTVYIDIFSHPNCDDYDISCMERAAIGATPCPPELLGLMKYERNMLPVCLYGMTEASPATNATFLGDPDELLLHTVGTAIDHTEIKIVDPQTKDIVPVNTVGEVCMRGYGIMRGYWDDPEKTAETKDEAGWLHSGDLAIMKENGYCSIVGRIKDVIIRGGSNVFPVEIENYLHQHPKVANVQVVGVPDERLGEEICACIQLGEGETSNVEEMKEFCKGKIAHFKIPRYVEFVESYPLTATLKVQKFRLAEMMAKKLGL